jgi:hypothetical protein
MGSERNDRERAKAQELGEAIARQGVHPRPTDDELANLGSEAERTAAVRASLVDLEAMPPWYQTKIAQWAAEGVAKAEAAGPQETLGEAFVRVGASPLPGVERLREMSPAQRNEAVRAATLTAEQYEQLPAWYRDKARARAEATVARLDSPGTKTS